MPTAVCAAYTPGVPAQRVLGAAHQHLWSVRHFVACRCCADNPIIDGVTHPKAKAYNGSSAPSIGSWACNTTGTYVMLFSNPNPHTQTSVYVRAHALDLAAWEDAQSLALLGLVNRRPVAAPAARLVQLSRQREKTEATRPTRYFGI